MEKEKSKFSIKSAQIIPLGFLMMILAGTILLMMPFSSATGEFTPFLTSLFTATTSVCVTGLVVVDTFSYWSTIGQVIILILIQLGGLGIIAVYSSFMLAAKRQISFRNRLLIRDAFNLDSVSGLIRFLQGVLKGTFAVEGIGACFYMVRFIPKYGVIKGIWFSIFTAISAFCNAGIDTLGADSLISYQNDTYLLFVTMGLIVLGGLGYVVWFDLKTTFNDTRKAKRGLMFYTRRLNEHTKLVLVLTATLIAAGAVIVGILEWNNPDTIGNMGIGGKIVNSIFQSVTFRTAGFAAVPQDGLTDATAIAGCIFMFIGGSPVGTAGGVKTVTLFLVFVNTVSFINNKEETVVFNRSVSKDLIRRASAIIFVSFMITFVFIVLLLATNDVNTTDALYEVTSATATVGLSRALTPTLNTSGRIIIILAMFLGRIGPISMAIFFSTNHPEKLKVKQAEGKYIVG